MEGVTQEVKAETGHTPTLVGIDIYCLSRWRAFYRSRVMVDPPGRNTGAGVLMATETIKRRPTCVARWFERLGPIETTVSRKNGKDTGTFYPRVGCEYKPSELEN